MDNLRDIVRRHVEKQTLRLFLQDECGSTSSEEKERLLNNLRSLGAIDSEVDNILNVFLHNIEVNSPRKKRRKWWSFAYASLNAILTALITYTAKQDYWIIVGGLAFSLVLVHGIFIHFNE
jgi:hypothetical protein